MTHHFFDFRDALPQDRYRLMANAVTPRPIAFVTTVDLNNSANAAPFSFFGLLSHDPPMLAIGIEPRPDGRRKDTAQNILDTGVFTVNLCDRALATSMDACSAAVEPGVDELALNLIPTLPGTLIPVPRIATAPAALECRLHTTVDLGPARDIIIGRIDGFFLREGALTESGHVDQDALDTIGRVGAMSYVTTRDRFRV